MTDAHPRPEIRPAAGMRVVRAGGAVLAESPNALEVLIPDAEAREVYFPMAEAGELFLEATDRTEDIPGLGRARRYDIMAKSGPIEGAAWAIETPAPGAEALRDHVAFDTERVAVERL
ncbi:MAG: DUF427 domain-containing protein [Pseudomonadota bacterium]